MSYQRPGSAGYVRPSSGSATGSGESGVPKMVAMFDFGSYGSQTYTTTGAQTLGGFSFSTLGIDATNTCEFVAGEGFRIVGGTTQEAGITFNPAVEGSFSTDEETNVMGWVAEFSDGTTVAGDVIVTHFGTDSNNVGNVQRRNGIVRTAVISKGAASANRDESVSAGTDMVALAGFIHRGLVGANYDTVAPTDSDHPTSLPGQGATNATFASDDYKGSTFMKISFIQKRNVYCRNVRIFQYAA